jgi:hypothetical protein
VKRKRIRGWVGAWFIFAVVVSGGMWGRAQSPGDEFHTGLGLADLAAYRTALSGETATDAHDEQLVPTVTFRDLWDHPETWSGRRVRVRGKILRIFRQDAVGGFPALAEAWLSAPAGDLFCTVFPTASVPDLGQTVAFTGTYLRTIRYAGADQPRLAPWIVGDRPPVRVAVANEESKTASVAAAIQPIDADNELERQTVSPGTRQLGQPFQSWSPAGWMLGIALGLAGAGIMVWQQVRRPLAGKPRGTRQQNDHLATADPPLEFIETEPVHGTAFPDARSH